MVAIPQATESIKNNLKGGGCFSNNRHGIKQREKTKKCLAE
jgi:hypothetical protein